MSRHEGQRHPKSCSTGRTLGSTAGASASTPTSPPSKRGTTSASLSTGRCRIAPTFRHHASQRSQKGPASESAKPATAPAPRTRPASMNHTTPSMIPLTGVSPRPIVQLPSSKTERSICTKTTGSRSR